MNLTVPIYKSSSLSDLPGVIQQALDDFNISSEKQLHRLTFIIPTIAPVNWLSVQPFDKKIYWADRDQLEMTAGVGVCRQLKSNHSNTDPTVFKELEKLLASADESVRFFGGGRFSSQVPKDPPWDEFGDINFILPRFELVVSQEDTRFHINIDASDKTTDLDQIKLEAGTINFDYIETSDLYSPPSLHRADYPSRDQWETNILLALENISREEYQKIVLARKTELTAGETIDPLGIFERLAYSADHCFHFYFQEASNLTFLGASPERLFYRDGNSLLVEALAGTRKRGEDDSEDTQLGNTLLNSEKERKEQALVTRSINDALAPYLQKNGVPKNGDVRLLKLKRVQHLLSRFELTLKNHVSSYDLIKALHPTAAVGGYPKNHIADLIYETETFDRGWYAAPIGWLSKNQAEFAVAIRSGLVNNNSVTLYSGAGIVAGSTPKGEWKEIENKIAGFKKALGI